MTWLESVDTLEPSVVVTARDSTGRDLRHIRVRIDGTLQVDSHDGRAIPVDPGQHTIRVEGEDGAFSQEDVVIREGQKGRSIEAILSAPRLLPVLSPISPPSPPSPTLGTKPRSHWVEVTSAVVGGAALLTWGVLGTIGYGEFRHLHETCGVTHRCSAEDVSGAKSKLFIADAAGGVALVSAGIFIWQVLVHRGDGPSPVNAHAVRGGAVASWEKAF